MLLYGHVKINVFTECQDVFGLSDFLCLVTSYLLGEIHCLVNCVTVLARNDEVVYNVRHLK